MEKEYGKTSYAWLWVVAGVLAGGVVLAGLIVVVATREKRVHRSTFEMPANVTPFTVIGLLKQIQQNNGFDETGQRELSASINRLEKYYFIEGDSDEPNIQEIAETWVGKARA